MFTVVITEKGGAQRRMDFDKNEVTIGRVQGNDIILPKGNVSKRHSRIVLKDNRFIVVDLKSTNGTYVNGRKITSPLVVKSGDKIYIGDFILTLEEGAGAYEEAPRAPSAPPPAPPVAPQPMPEPEPPAPQPMQAAPPRRRSQGAPPPLRPQSQPQSQRAPAPPPLPAREPEPAPPQADRFALDEEPSEDRAAPPRVAPARQRTSSREQPRPPMAQPVALPPMPQMPHVLRGAGDVDPALRSVMMRVSHAFDIHDASPASLHDRDRWGEAQHAVESALGQLQNEGQLAPGIDREALVGAAVREAMGPGALEPLLSDETVREIVVEGPSRIVADFGNGLEPVQGGFSSVDSVITIARRLIAQAGEMYDPTRAIYETTLPYGPHVTIVLPPVAVRGPVIEIRRMGRTPTAETLVEQGWMNGDMLEVLREAVRGRRNLMVAGAVGAGVTTLLGALAGLTEEHERLVTVEDVPDLHIDREHVISLGAGSANGKLNFRSVLHQASKLRSDRLVVDDVRGEEAWDVLATVAARRPGNFIGVHAAQGRDAVEHVKRLVRLGGRSSDELGDLVAQAVGLLVQVECGPDGTRRVTRISEVVGSRGDDVETQDLFVYDGQFNKV